MRVDDGLARVNQLSHPTVIAQIRLPGEKSSEDIDQRAGIATDDRDRGATFQPLAMMR
jgi:hypothetical protein